MNKKHVAALGVTLGVLGGGAAGFAFVVPTIATAQTSPSTTPTTPTTTPAGTTGTTAPAADRSTWMKDALAPLVANGTITQAQADAVIAALGKAAPAGGHRGPGGPGMGGDHIGFGNLDTVASTLGMTTADLRTAIDGGQTIADIAKSKSVDVQKVIDALVADLKTHLASEVTSGEHTQAEADQILATATTAITDFVNGKIPARGAGMGRGMGGPFGRGPKGSTTTPTTTPAGTGTASTGSES